MPEELPSLEKRWSVGENGPGMNAQDMAPDMPSREFWENIVTVYHARFSPSNSVIDPSEAFEYFGYKIVWNLDEYDSYGYGHTMPGKIVSSQSVGLNEVENPAFRSADAKSEDSDFFDNLRTLKSLLKELSYHIGSKNDPEMRVADVQALKSYIGAFRAFIDPQDEKPPERIPVQLPHGLLDRLQKVDWMAMPERLHNMAVHIGGLIKTLFGS